MNSEEQFLAGLLGFLVVAGIVVLFVLMFKKKGHHRGPSPGPAAVPACHVSGGNGVCTSGINTQGKRNCVGEDQLCGVNLKAHQAVHPNDDSCASLSKYLPHMIQCNDGYQAYIDGDGKSNQGNCLFKCKKSNSENLTCGSACDPQNKYSCGAASDGCTECAANGSDSGYGCMPPSK